MGGAWARDSVHVSCVSQKEQEAVAKKTLTCELVLMNELRCTRLVSGTMRIIRDANA